MIEVMIDIETLGTRPGDVVWEIGAVEFDRHTGALGRRIDRRVDVLDAVRCGMTVDEDTADWWRRRGWIDQRGAGTVAEVVGDVIRWVEDVQPRLVWAWGADFEAKMLQAMWSAVRVEDDLPWKYSRMRCARTLWGEARPGQYHSDQAHRALPDAEKQAQELVEALRELGLAGGGREH